MATHDYVIANGTGAAVRSDLNNALAAIVSNNSGSSEPGTTYAYQWWADTNANVLKIRNSSNDGWITLRELDGTMLIEDGSASTPGLAFADDVNTGIFSPAADQIGFATGGAERLEIGSSEVVFNDPSNDVDFRVESNGNTHMLFVDAGNDQVGIGISTPSKPLHIYQASDAGIRIQNSTTGTGTTDGLLLEATGSDGLLWNYESGNLRFATGNSERARIDSSGRLLSGVTSAPGTVGGFSHLNIKGTSINANGAIGLYRNTASPSAGQGIGAIYFANSDGNAGAYIQGQSDGTWGTNDYPGRLVFFTTADGASSATERMRITSSGNVEIGNNTGLFIDNTSGTARRVIHIDTDNNLYLNSNPENNSIIFQSGGANERMRVTNNGLTFNGDTAAANALDDYEEGTFTPTIDVSGVSGTLSVSYLSQNGRYIKVGRTVFFTIDIRLSNFSRGTGTGGIVVGSLPHVPVNSSNFARSNGLAHLYDWNYSSTAADIPIFSIRQTGSQSFMDLRNHRLNNTDSDVNDPNNDSMIFIAGTYETVS